MHILLYNDSYSDEGVVEHCIDVVIDTAFLGAVLLCTLSQDQDNLFFQIMLLNQIWIGSRKFIEISNNLHLALKT